MNERRVDDETFEWKGRTGPFSLRLAPGVFVPTHTSLAVAEAMEIRPGDEVADIGCGCGVLAIVAARLGAGRVVGVDISADAVEVARGNAAGLGLEAVTEFRAGDLCEPLGDESFDVVIGDVSGMPDPIAELAGWLPGGGPTGAENPVAMLKGVDPALRPGGRLYLPTGSIQDDEAVVAVARDLFGADRVELVGSRYFPLATSVAASPVVDELMAAGVVRLESKGSRRLWELRLWCCRRD